MKSYYDAYDVIVLDSSDILEGADLTQGYLPEFFRVSEQKYNEAAIVFYNDGENTYILKNKYGGVGKIVKKLTS